MMELYSNVSLLTIAEFAYSPQSIPGSDDSHVITYSDRTRRCSLLAPQTSCYPARDGKDA